MPGETEPEPDRVDHATHRTLYAMSRTGVADVLLTLYFCGAVVAPGVIGLTNGSDLGSLFGGGILLEVYSWAMVFIGVAGIVARLADSRMGEFYAITGVSLLTIFNGIALLPEHPGTTLRLVFAPCMMLPYAWMRLGFTINRAEVYSLKQAISDASDDDR